MDMDNKYQRVVDCKKELSEAMYNYRNAIREIINNPEINPGYKKEIYTHLLLTHILENSFSRPYDFVANIKWAIKYFEKWIK